MHWNRKPSKKKKRGEHLRNTLNIKCFHFQVRSLSYIIFSTEQGEHLKKHKSEMVCVRNEAFQAVFAFDLAPEEMLFKR